MHAFGTANFGDARAKAVNADTIYDVASFTKAVVTTTLIAMLREENEIDLDAPLARYLPEWAAGGETRWRAFNITVRHLLTHSSGLPAHEDFFKAAKNARHAIVARVMASPLAYEPGTQSIYSDLGFIALGEIIERLTGRPLDQLARERIFTPLGMADTSFNPPKSLRAHRAHGK